MFQLLTQTLVAFVATVAFGVLFQVPREQYAFSGICGAAGWLCYLLVMQNYPSTTIASFAAAVVQDAGDRFFDLRHLPAGAGGRHLLHRLLFHYGGQRDGAVQGD